MSALMMMLVAPAAAQPFTVVEKAICFRIEPHMEDDGSGIDDAIVEGVSEPARGAAARVVDVTNPAAPLLVHEGYTTFTGANPGCTPPLILDTTHTYRVTVWTSGRVAGHDVSVMVSPANPTKYAWVVPAFVPNIFPGDVYLTVGVGRRWQAYLVASHALWRNDGGLDGLDLKVYLADCPYVEEGGTCFDRAPRRCTWRPTRASFESTKRATRSGTTWRGPRWGSLSWRRTTTVPTRAPA